MTSPLSAQPDNWQKHKHRATIVAVNEHLSHFAEALTFTNPVQDKQLAKELSALDRKKRTRALELFMAQRQFFIDRAFDSNHELRFLKVLRQNSSLSDEKEDPLKYLYGFKPTRSRDEATMPQNNPNTPQQSQQSRTDSRRTRFDAHRMIDISASRDSWITEHLCTSSSLSERFFPRSAGVGRGVSANQSLIAHEEKRRRKLSVGQQEFKRSLSRPGHRDTDTFLDFIMRDEGKMQVEITAETTSPKANAENIHQQGHKEKPAQRRTVQKPATARENSPQRMYTANAKHNRNPSCRIRESEREKKASPVKATKPILRSHSFQDINPRMVKPRDQDLKSASVVFQENDGKETSKPIEQSVKSASVVFDEKVNEQKPPQHFYANSQPRLVKSESDLGKYSLQHQEQTQRRSASSGQYDCLHSNSRSNLYSRSFVSVGELGDIAETPGEDTEIHERTEKLLARITKSLPAHLLANSESDRHSLSDVMGYTDRNRYLLKRERIRSARETKRDPRFINLMQSLQPVQGVKKQKGVVF